MSSYETHVISGLPVHVFGLKEISQRDLAVVFFLHGRLGKWEDNISFIEQLLRDYDHTQLPLAVVTFDQRNHGHRKTHALANHTWTDETPNLRHAEDMHSIQVGTAQDCSLLIDYLPSYLFPRGQRRIVEWACAGISLGGHATWLVLSNEPRVRVGCPIIGCPDFLELMQRRIETNTKLAAQELISVALRETIARVDPQVGKIAGKSILVCSGARDKLVPYAAGEKFVSKLRIQANVRVKIYENVGHRCTKSMISDVAAFLGSALGIASAKM
ncbi:hypothetical protein PYCC9005_000289 [Savitreella phatthalungensis]